MLIYCSCALLNLPCMQQRWASSMASNYICIGCHIEGVVLPTVPDTHDGSHFISA